MTVLPRLEVRPKILGSPIPVHHRETRGWIVYTPLR